MRINTYFVFKPTRDWNASSASWSGVYMYACKAICSVNSK